MADIELVGLLFFGAILVVCSMQYTKPLAVSFLMTLPTVFYLLFITPELHEYYGWYIAGPMVILAMCLLLKTIYNAVSGRG